MYAKFKGELLFLLGCLLSYLHVHYKLDFSHFHVGGMWGSLICLILKDSPLVAKLESLAGVSVTSSSGSVIVTKAGTAAAVLLALGMMGGCANLQPATIQADTAAGLTVALTGYSIAQPEKAKEIQADAKTVGTIIDTVVLPTFKQSATAGTLLNGSASQAMTLLNSKIVGLKNGPMIVAEIKLALGLFTSALSGTASPTAAMSAQAQADLIAFFTGVSQALASFTGGQ